MPAEKRSLLYRCSAIWTETERGRFETGRHSRHRRWGGRQAASRLSRSQHEEGGHDRDRRNTHKRNQNQRERRRGDRRGNLELGDDGPPQPGEETREAMVKGEGDGPESLVCLTNYLGDPLCRSDIRVLNHKGNCGVIRDGQELRSSVEVCARIAALDPGDDALHEALQVSPRFSNGTVMA